MNTLYVGLGHDIELPRGGFLLLDDEAPDLDRARVFDPRIHSFNPLKDIEYKKARRLSEILYTLSPEGEATLTVRNGKRAMLHALLRSKALDKVHDDDEVMGLLDNILVSPVLRRVFCQPTNFSFNPRSVIVARVNRQELGEFDALVLGLFLMEQFTGQLVVPDFGFYGREVHSGLLRSQRLIAGVRFLSELPPKLRKDMMLIEDKRAAKTTFEDAETLAKYARLMPGTNEYNDFVHGAIA